MWVEELSMAIIRQAADDYRVWTKNVNELMAIAVPTKKQLRDLKDKKRELAELEEFFLSDWFYDLAMGRIDGQEFLYALKAKCKAESKVA